MSKWSDRMSIKNFKEDGLNALYVTMGLVAGTLVDRGVNYVAEKWFPSLAPYVNGAKALGQVGGGLVLSVLSNKDTAWGHATKFMGYGLTASGVIAGARMIPQVDAFLSNQTTTKTTSVNGLDLLGLGDFGRAENIKQITTLPAETVDVDLPELGYSSSYTESADESSAQAEPSILEESFGEVI